MRRTSWPPVWRANAQLKRNVRTSPTWGLPVGEGGKRTLILGAAAASRAASTTGSVTGRDPIREAADAGNRDLDLVADLHRPDALGRAGEDHVSGQQRHHAGDVGDQGRDVEDQVLGGPVLLDVAVEEGLHGDAIGEVLRVEVGLDPRPQGAERVESLRPGELHVLL